MKQSEIVAAVEAGNATFSWVELAPGLEVMALPVRIAGDFVAVSARTTQACASALTRDDWVCTLTTPKIEDLVYARAEHKPEPVLLNPSTVNIASDLAIRQHSQKLAARLGVVPDTALVACGKSWVLTNGLLSHPGHAANYGFFSLSAPYKSENGVFRLWQPLSFVHNFDHFDYSQMLRLVRRRPNIELPSYEVPLRVPEANAVSSGPALPESGEDLVVPAIAHGTLGERCLTWCLQEMAEHEAPDAERIAFYHAVAVRNGKLLGIKTGNHCASAQSRALMDCLLSGEVKPHEPRAAAVELQRDAQAGGRFRSIVEVRAGKWLPRPGDLAIYDRSTPGQPSTAWQRHVDRVIRVSDDGKLYENIGANETSGGGWKREWTPFASPKLLGFVEYPGIPEPQTKDADSLASEHVG